MKPLRKVNTLCDKKLLVFKPRSGTSKTNDEEFNKHLIKCAHLKTNTICELYKNECSWTEVQETAEKESKEITPGRGTLGQECSSASCPCINKGLVCYHGFCHECVTDEDCPIYASCLSVKNFARQDNDKRLTKNVNLCVNSLEVPKLMKNFAPDAIASYRECYEMTKMANLWAMSNFVKDSNHTRNFKLLCAFVTRLHQQLSENFRYYWWKLWS